MRGSPLLAMALAAALGCAVAPAGAAPTNKCMVNGTVTYQQGPCASGQVRKQPTLQEFNAAEKQRRAATAANKAEQSPSAQTPTISTTPAAAVMTAAYRCDGRQHCSQMQSCAEAKYFLRHCPGVKMDGDNDGIPCENQWCAQ